MELTGGLSEIENRALLELGESAGARKTLIHCGKALSDPEVVALSQGGVGDGDKASQFGASATARRSTSSLDAISASTNDVSRGVGIFADRDCRPCDGRLW
jgi:hypothetical protein